MFTGKATQKYRRENLFLQYNPSKKIIHLKYIYFILSIV